MQDSVRVAAIAVDSKPGDVHGNLAKIDQWVSRAGEQGAVLALFPVRCRCAENGAFGLACNSVGHVEFAGVEQTFPGGGMAIGPRGEVLSEWPVAGGEPGMLVTEFRRDTLQEARAEPEYLFRFRRPELYGPLAE